VRFLVDQNRSPRLAELLRAAGHDATHTIDLGLERATDDELLALAAEQRRVVITGDTDFGALLALTQRRSPSVILFRGRNTPRAAVQARLILEYLDELTTDLNEGAVIVITDDRIRIRRLPLIHDT
jgi:predicted nuclease of predicted toxin-antitoxin system